MKDSSKTKSQLIKEIKNLRSLNARYDSIIGASDDAIISVDLNYNIVFFNKGAEKAFGYSPDEILGKPLGVLVPARLREAHGEHMKDFALGEEPSIHMSGRSVIYALRKDGTVFPVDASVTRYSTGDEITYTAILRDVSAREESQERLEHAHSLLRATLDATVDGIISIDMENRITDINRKYIRMWDLPESIAESKDFSLLIGHLLERVKEPDCIRRTVRHLEQHPEKAIHEFIELKDGRIFEHTSSSQIIGGEVVGIVCSYRDITQERHLIRKLNESVARLSKKNRYESIISSINNSLSESYKIQEILDGIVSAIGTNLKLSDFVSIYFIEGQEAVLKAHSGYPGWFVAEAGRIPRPWGFTWKAISDNKPVLYCSDTDTDTAIGPAGRKLGTRSYISMPFGENGGVTGTINVHSYTKDAFEDEELTLLENVARQIEAAIRKVKISEALRQSEERYRILFDQSPVGVYIFDTGLKITQCNKRIVEILQTPHEAIVGFNLRNVKDKSIVPMIEEAVGGRHSYYEGMYEATFSRAKLWLSQRFAPLYDLDGKVIGGMGVVEDITERKEAEEALRKTQQGLSDAQRIAHLGNWDWDIVTNDLTWSDEVYRIFGYEPREFDATYGSFLNSVHPDDRDRVKKAVEDALYRGAIYSIDHRIVLPDGSERIVHEQAEVVFDDYGKPLRMIGTVLDITDLRKTEHALMEQERMLSTVLTGLPGCTYRCNNDDEFSFQFLSEGIVSLTGYTADDFISKRVNFVELVHPDDLPHIMRDVYDALKWHRMYELVYRIKTARNGEKWLWDKGQGIYSPTGSLEYIEGFATDITERKQLEERLYQSQKMEAVGMLAGGIAHDFNNLLTIILNYSDLLLSRPGMDKKLEESLREIRSAGERAAGLTNQLLAFSRKQILQPVVLDLNAVVDDVEKMIRRLIGEDIELVADLEPGLWRVKADPGQIVQVVVNLAVNARDAMPNGGTLRMRTSNVHRDEASAGPHPCTEGGRCVMLSISDTGEGMDETTINRIFEPFFTTKGQGKGTGLGLATVYGIIEQSGGNITVDSGTGRGTTFNIYLPAVDEQPRQAEDQTSRPARAQGGPETILIIEDQREVLSLLSMVLKEAGHEVLEASDCDEALSICGQHGLPIHLMLIDVVMPKMSGPELAVRLSDIHPEAKILFMSGYIDTAVTKIGVLRGAKSFLQKPFTHVALLSKVRETLDSAR